MKICDKTFHATGRHVEAAFQLHVLGRGRDEHYDLSPEAADEFTAWLLEPKQAPEVGVVRKKKAGPSK